MDSFETLEDILYSHSNNKIIPGLARILRLLNRMNNPQNSFKSVHIVGTNGKGSTGAMISSVLTASGYKTGFYSSPHLESPAERLLIDGKELSVDKWIKAVNFAVKNSPGGNYVPSYFELLTAGAFQLAKNEKIEAGVIEAGLGGKLDATNTMNDTVCSVIASISFDHMEYLGNTLESIAGEKFAVVKKNVPAVFSGVDSSLIPLFIKTCEEKGAVPFVVSEQTRVENVEVTDEGSTFDFISPGMTLRGVRLNLIGKYQINNARLALSAISFLREAFPKITPDSILEGMSKAKWPGRLEIISRDPLIILDGGHNPDGIRKLFESIGELWPNKKFSIVYAAMRDKHYSGCFKMISKTLNFKPKPRLYVTSVPGMKRSETSERLQAVANIYRWSDCPVDCETPEKAIERALNGNDSVIICGSLYLVGYIKRAMNNKSSLYRLMQFEFIRLCEQGSRSEIEEAIATGVDIDKHSRIHGDFMNAIFAATLKGNKEAVKVLLEHGADVCDAFHFAVWKNQKKPMKFLVECGADINRLGRYGSSPLFYAVEYNKPRCVKWLIELGADVNLKLSSGQTVLTHMAEKYTSKKWYRSELNPEIYSILIEAGADYSDAVLMALNAGDISFLKLLIECGADLNSEQWFKDKHKPLITALFAGMNKINRNMIRFLAENGADVNETFEFGEIILSPLSFSAMLNMLDIVKILLANGADPNYIDSTGRTSLYYSILVGTEMVKTLLANGADPNLSDFDERTPLMVAAIDMGNEPEIIKTLIDYGANINAQDKDGVTALEWAIVARDRTPGFFLSGLIRTGMLGTEYGKICFWLIALFVFMKRSAQIEAVKILVERGADIRLKDKKGMDPVQHAIVSGDNEILDILLGAEMEELNV